MGKAAYFTPAAFPEPIQVLLSEDRLTADLLMMPLHGNDPPSVEMCCQHLQRRGIIVDDFVRRIVGKVLEALPRASRNLRATVAQGNPAIDGNDGRIEWSVDWIPHENAPADSGDELSSFTYVYRGQRLGRIIAATEGRSGRDVTGAVIAAHQGRPVKLDLDESVARDDDEQLIARVDGFLRRDGSRLFIRESLDSEEQVDLLMGEIGFDGDRSAAGGSRSA